jgi:hypothetical protein
VPEFKSNENEISLFFKLLNETQVYLIQKFETASLQTKTCPVYGSLDHWGPKIPRYNAHTLQSVSGGTLSIPPLRITGFVNF